MQHKGIEVRAVGPRNGPQFVVHPNLREEVGVGKWLEHGATELSSEVDIALAAIAEGKPQPVVAKDLDGRDLYEVHALILRQWVDRLGAAAVSRTRPVCLELLAVQIGPLCHELERASR